MNEKTKKDKVDIRINKIIIDTTAVIIGIFVTIGLVMSQVFEKGGERFYEFIGWSTSLTIPFIVSTIVSIVIIAYNQELSSSWLWKLRHFSVVAYIFSWFWLVFNGYVWSPQWFSTVINALFGFLLFAILIVLVINLVYLRFRKPKKQSSLQDYL